MLICNGMRFNDMGEMLSCLNNQLMVGQARRVSQVHQGGEVPMYGDNCSTSAPVDCMMDDAEMTAHFPGTAAHRYSVSSQHYHVSGPSFELGPSLPKARQFNPRKRNIDDDAMATTNKQFRLQY